MKIIKATPSSYARIPLSSVDVGEADRMAQRIMTHDHDPLCGFEHGGLWCNCGADPSNPVPVVRKAPEKSGS